VGDRGQVPLGIQIRLAPEWKTYWRSPGEAGIPPRFDWSKSENLDAITIGWPAPVRYDAFGLETIGYKDEVIFPVTAVLEAPGKALSARLTLGYAVCRDICVPLKADLALQVPEGAGSRTPFAALIKDFTARVPRLVPADAAPKLPALQKVCFEDHGSAGRLRVVLSGVEKSNGKGLFIEAGNDFGFEAPETVAVDEEGNIVMTVPVHRYRKRAELKDRPLRLTLVAGNGSFEWLSRLCSD